MLRTVNVFLTGQSGQLLHQCHFSPVNHGLEHYIGEPGAWPWRCKNLREHLVYHFYDLYVGDSSAGGLKIRKSLLLEAP